MQHHSLTQTLRSGCAIIQQLVIYAMTSLYFQESLFLQSILLAQQQALQNQRWWAQLFFDSLMIMVTSIRSRWPTWITCPSLQSTYSQLESSANNLQGRCHWPKNIYVAIQPSDRARGARILFRYSVMSQLVTLECSWNKCCFAKLCFLWIGCMWFYGK